MEERLARYCYKLEVYDGQMTHVIHHLEFDFDDVGRWAARLLCTRQFIAAGHTRSTRWDEQPFVLEEMVTCLTCLVRAGPLSS
jgi:hypothetical protein